MRTTIRLNQELLRQAKLLAARTNRTFTAVVEDALRQSLSRPVEPRAAKRKLPTFRGKGLCDGVDISNSAALLDLMEQETPLERRR